MNEEAKLFLYKQLKEMEDNNNNENAPKILNEEEFLRLPDNLALSYVFLYRDEFLVLEQGARYLIELPSMDLAGQDLSMVFMRHFTITTEDETGKSIPCKINLNGTGAHICLKEIMPIRVESGTKGNIRTCVYDFSNVDFRGCDVYGLLHDEIRNNPYKIEGKENLDERYLERRKAIEEKRKSDPKYINFLNKAYERIVSRKLLAGLNGIEKYHDEMDFSDYDLSEVEEVYLHEKNPKGKNYIKPDAITENTGVGMVSRVKENLYHYLLTRGELSNEVILFGRKIGKKEIMKDTDLQKMYISFLLESCITDTDSKEKIRLLEPIKQRTKISADIISIISRIPGIERRERLNIIKQFNCDINSNEIEKILEAKGVGDEEKVEVINQWIQWMKEKDISSREEIIINDYENILRTIAESQVTSDEEKVVLIERWAEVLSPFQFSRESPRTPEVRFKNGDEIAKAILSIQNVGEERKLELIIGFLHNITSMSDDTINIILENQEIDAEKKEIFLDWLGNSSVEISFDIRLKILGNQEIDNEVKEIYIEDLSRWNLGREEIKEVIKIPKLDYELKKDFLNRLAARETGTVEKVLKSLDSYVMTIGALEKVLEIPGIELEEKIKYIDEWTKYQKEHKEHGDEFAPILFHNYERVLKAILKCQEPNSKNKIELIKHLSKELENTANFVSFEDSDEITKAILSIPDIDGKEKVELIKPFLPRIQISQYTIKEISEISGIENEEKANLINQLNSTTNIDNKINAIMETTDIESKEKIRLLEPIIQRAKISADIISRISGIQGIESEERLGLIKQLNYNETDVNEINRILETKGVETKEKVEVINEWTQNLKEKNKGSRFGLIRFYDYENVLSTIAKSQVTSDEEKAVLIKRWAKELKNTLYELKFENGDEIAKAILSIQNIEGKEKMELLKPFLPNINMSGETINIISSITDIDDQEKNEIIKHINNQNKNNSYNENNYQDENSSQNNNQRDNTASSIESPIETPMLGSSNETGINKFLTTEVGLNTEEISKLERFYEDHAKDLLGQSLDGLRLKKEILEACDAVHQGFTEDSDILLLKFNVLYARLMFFVKNGKEINPDELKETMAMSETEFADTYGQMLGVKKENQFYTRNVREALTKKYPMPVNREEMIKRIRAVSHRDIEFK